MALGLDQAEGEVMKRTPRHPKEGVFAEGLRWKIICRGFLIGVSDISSVSLLHLNEHPN